MVECITKEVSFMMEFKNGSTIRVIAQSAAKRGLRGLSCNTLLCSGSLLDYHQYDTNMIREFPYQAFKSFASDRFEIKMYSELAAEENTDCCETSKELENFLNGFKVVSKNVAAQQ